MTDETNTFASAETDNVEHSEADTPETYDYYDPDEDQDTEEVVTDEGTDEEAVEGEEEAQETEDQAEEEPEEEPEPKEADLKAVVKLQDGTTTTVEELLKGQLRQSDYTRKQQEVANLRKSVEADASRIEGITQAFIDHLASMMPDEPDAALVYRDPNAYTQQKARYDATVAQMQKLIELGNQPKQIKQAMTQADADRIKAEENSKLVGMFPKTATQDGRAKFFENVATVASELGISEKEWQGISDHRLLALAHWAKVGMDAEKARSKAKAKAAKAPPATPRKPGQTAAKANRNVDAMRKLARSGSIHDALAVDWD